MHKLTRCMQARLERRGHQSEGAYISTRQMLIACRLESPAVPHSRLRIIRSSPKRITQSARSFPIIQASSTWLGHVLSLHCTSQVEVTVAFTHQSAVVQIMHVCKRNFRNLNRRATNELLSPLQPSAEHTRLPS